MDLPRINSRTPLQPAAHPPPPALSPMHLNPSVAALLAAFNPRKPKQRTTFAALLVLVCLTTYIFIAHSASISSAALRHSDSSAADQLAMALETIQNSRLAENKLAQKPHHHHKHIHVPSLKLDPSQELAAVSSFLASLPQNVLPPTVDPKVPIDPQLVLDFDTRTSKAKEEVEAMVEDVWTRNPVFVYAKHFSPSSRELKSMLSELHLKPAPTIIDVDTREDAEVLTPMIARLTGSTQLPVLLIAGKVVGSTDEVRELLKTKELQKMMAAAGSQINGAKRKKHRR